LVDAKSAHTIFVSHVAIISEIHQNNTHFADYKHSRVLQNSLIYFITTYYQNQSAHIICESCKSGYNQRNLSKAHCADN